MKKEKILNIIKDKRMIVMLFIVIAIIVISVSLFFITSNKNVNQNQKNISVDKKLTNLTKKTQKNLEFSSIDMKKVGANTVVTGKVKNKTSSDLEVKLKMNLYYKKGELGGSSETGIRTVKAKETNKFKMTIVGDYTVCEKYEVIVVSATKK